MTTKSSCVSDLYLDDIRDRVYEKYDVSYSDSELAVEYLRCFLAEKRTQPHTLIILPQIADWAWHEIVLDTVRYRALCAKLFGRFLHHVIRPLRLDDINQDEPTDERDIYEDRNSEGHTNLRCQFFKSLEMMRSTYDLRLGNCPDHWLDAGWDRPIYRLRKPIQRRYNGNLRSDADNDTDAKRSDVLNVFSWLPYRITHRFGIPLDAAKRGVDEYSRKLLSLRYPQRPDALNGCSIECEIAWEEHILWTRRYAADCHRLLGYFLDHSPRVIGSVLT